MITRYTNPEMGHIWTPENRYRKWLDIEIYAAEAMARLDLIPAAAVEQVKEKTRDFCRPEHAQRIEEIERETRHDVAAFLDCLEELAGEPARYLHLGMTSSDVLDTTFAIQLKEAADLIESDLESLREALKRQAHQHRDTVMIGRTHGVHAEPVTFGLVMALFYEEMGRNLRRLRRAREEIAVGKVSGAVGTFANLPPEVEAHVCRRVGLTPAAISSQILQRDRHAEFFTTLAIIAGSVEKLALEVRLLQRTEVGEAMEPFGAGQKGSSAMPHKRNPIVAENLSGLSRVVRTNALAALENIPLWHQRDISHSSVERVIGPDSTILVDYLLRRATWMIDGLTVDRERMRANLGLSRGLIYSQKALLELIRKGLKRGEAYRLVQRNAMRTFKNGSSFKEVFSSDPEVTRLLSPAELDEAFSLEHHLQHVETIFSRVFGS